MSFNDWLDKIFPGRQAPEKIVAGDYTHIEFILDASGSMAILKGFVVESFNGFIQEQKKLPGNVSFSLVTFEGGDARNIKYAFQDLKDVKELTALDYQLGGSTPLFDAIGLSIDDLKKQFARLDAHKRPSKVVIAIMTDGDENSSNRYTKQQAMTKIEDQKRLDCKIALLTSELSALKTAESAGIRSQSMSGYAASQAGVANAFNNLSRGIGTYRGASSASSHINLKKESDGD